MIIELLFGLFFGLIDFIISLIPSFDLNINLGFISGLAPVFQYLGMFVDIPLVLLIISATIIRDNFVFLKNILLAIINKLPFIN